MFLVSIFFINISCFNIKALTIQESSNIEESYSISYTDDEKYFLKLVGDFEQLYKTSFINATQAVTNKFASSDNKGVLEKLEFNTILVRSVIDDLEKSLKSNVYSDKYKLLARKTLIAANYYSLALNVLIAYINDTNNITESDDLQYFTFNLTKGLENITAVKRLITGGL